LGFDSLPRISILIINPNIYSEGIVDGNTLLVHILTGNIYIFGTRKRTNRFKSTTMAHFLFALSETRIHRTDEAGKRIPKRNHKGEYIRNTSGHNS